MKDNKKIFHFYTLVWALFLVVLLSALYRMYGDEHIVNYTGVVRGCTQKVILGETLGNQDEELIDYVDTVITDLIEASQGFNSFGEDDNGYQEQLVAINELWSEIKLEIENFRISGDYDYLYELSEEHYQAADDLVHYVEEVAEEELEQFFTIFSISFVITICLFFYQFYRNRRELIKKTNYDPITNIYSQIGFMNKLEDKLKSRDSKKFILIGIDIVNFKVYNHRYDHAFADRILKGVGDALLECCGENGICGRINGDNFKLFVENKEDIITVLDTCLREKLLQSGLALISQQIEFIFSAYAISDDKEETYSILSKVNLAHSYAKTTGLNGVIWYDESFVTRLRLEDEYTSRLEEAIKNKEFKMYLQPQLNLQSMIVSSAEALVRWEPQRGHIIYPNEFIKLYEDKKLISLLDYYMLEEVCIYLVENNLMKQHFKIAINFSRVTLDEEDFLDKFNHIIHKYEVDPSALEIEMTETSLSQIESATISKLNTLSNKGITITMDDFGAGYSNITLLAELPLNILKLDREFLNKLDTTNMPDILTSVIAMAHNIDLKVVCEGVETEENIVFLKNSGCDYVQGYYIHRPMPASKFTEKYIL